MLIEAGGAPGEDYTTLDALIESGADADQEEFEAICARYWERVSYIKRAEGIRRIAAQCRTRGIELSFKSVFQAAACRDQGSCCYFACG